MTNALIEHRDVLRSDTNGHVFWRDDRGVAVSACGHQVTGMQRPVDQATCRECVMAATIAGVWPDVPPDTWHGTCDGCGTQFTTSPALSRDGEPCPVCALAGNGPGTLRSDFIDVEPDPDD